MRVHAQGGWPIETISHAKAPRPRKHVRAQGGWRLAHGVQRGHRAGSSALAGEAEGAYYGTDSISGKTPIFPLYSPAERV